jgi:hypothetical protein
MGTTKKDLIRSATDPEAAEKSYPAFMVNRAFSYYADTVLHAQEMNRAGELPNLMQHDYYLHSLRAKKRFAKWHKAEKDETVDLIARAYSINIHDARVYLSLMSPEDIEAVRTRMDTGGR